MTVTEQQNERISKMTLASVFPHYLEKVEKKGRSSAELYEIIEWLTGFDKKAIQKLILEKVTFEAFFKKAKLHQNAHLIKGVICGYRIEDIPFPLTQKVRYLDKIVDELAKGRAIEKIKRS